MRGLVWLCLALLGAGLVASVPALPLRATDLLANGELESWNGTGPVSWNVSGVVAQGPGRSGNGAIVTGSGGLQQTADAVAGATYSAAVWSAGDSGTTVTLRLAWTDASANLLLVSTAAGTPGPAWGPVSLDATAPAGAARVRFEVSVSAGGGVATSIDSATLEQTSAPPPTPTPSPTPTPPAAFTATSTPTVGTVPPTPTRTATPTRTPTSPQGVPATATRTATAIPPPPPTATASPPVSTYGGLIANGDFEALTAEGKPAYWAKFGGTLSATGLSYRGAWSATLSTDGPGTRWLTQPAPAEGGSWYRAEAWVRLLQGAGEAFIRLSWYASSDGSGANIGQDDSDVATTGSWTYLATASVQAPVAAQSVRMRLMLRSAGDGTAAFDDASLVEVSAPPPATATAPAVPTDVPTASSTATSTTRAGSTARPVTPTRTPRPGGSSSPPGPGNAPPGGFSIAPVAGPESLRLSEVMSNPPQTGRETAFEWVELVNVGSEPVSTLGWRLGDTTELDVLPEALIPPGGFLVVAGPSASFGPDVPVLRVSDGSIGNGLNNAGDLLRLLSPTGAEVDSLSYGDNSSVFDPPPPAPAAGETLGVRVAGGDPDGSNWAVTLRPTPGAPNEFPVEEVAGASTQPTQPAGSAAPARAAIAEESDPSTIPWIVFGVAIGAGLIGLAALGTRSWPAVLARLRRGR